MTLDLHLDLTDARSTRSPHLVIREDSESETPGNAQLRGGLKFEAHQVLAVPVAPSNTKERWAKC